MAAIWQFSIGNVVKRAPTKPVVTGTPNTLYPASRWGDGFADTPGGWTFDASGAYAADFDLNLLSATTDRVDAPLGWADLPNLLAGTPGLPANPIETGTFAARTAFKLYRPVYQDVLVMPGEDVKIEGGIHVPAASDATGVEVLVQDLATGQFWKESPSQEWESAGVAASQGTEDAWLDYAVEIAAAAGRLAPAYYRVIVRPVAGAYTASTYVYLSDPSLCAEIDTVAFVGHSIPLDAVIAFTDDSNTATWTFSPNQQPVCSYVDNTPVFYRNWTLLATVDGDAAPYTQPPRIGEVWLGKARDFTSCPLMGVSVDHDQPGMVISEGARGRSARWTDSDMGRRVVTLRFRASAAGYQQFRDEVYMGSRGGADSVLVIGETYETGLTVFGKYEPNVSFTRSGPSRWSYESKVWEEPRWSNGSQTPASIPA